MTARVGALWLFLLAPLAGCDRVSEPQWWDDGPAPPPAREIRVLAPSGRLAPTAWGGRVLFDGRQQDTSPLDPFLVLPVPQVTPRVQILLPGCVPLELVPGPGRTFARLVAGPAVTLLVVMPPSFDPVERRLHVSLLPQEERNVSKTVSLAGHVVATHTGFTTAGAPVPRDGRVHLHVSAPGPHYITWTLERGNSRWSHSDSRGVMVDVPEEGRLEPIEAPLPEYVQKAGFR